MIDVNKYGGYVFYYIFNKGKLILIGRAYIARNCYSLLPGLLVCKGKIKNKMFKKNVKGMQQNIKAGVLARALPKLLIKIKKSTIYYIFPNYFRLRTEGVLRSTDTRFAILNILIMLFILPLDISVLTMIS